MVDKKQFELAYELYRQRPTPENGRELLAFAGDWLRTKEIASIGPCLAIIEVLNERGHFKKSWIGKFIQLRMPRMLRHYFPPQRPGWNDYHMCRWQLTKNPHDAQEIHRRMMHVSGGEWDMVQYTANWMAKSQRKENSEFDAALKDAEKLCGICNYPILTPLQVSE